MFRGLVLIAYIILCVTLLYYVLLYYLALPPERGEGRAEKQAHLVSLKFTTFPKNHQEYPPP